jgi:hypothetical protein
LFPTKAGALSYLLKSVLHDWPDSHALRILHNVVAAAMKGGYSKLLVVKNGFSDDGTGVELVAAALYLTMVVHKHLWLHLVLEGS